MQSLRKLFARFRSCQRGVSAVEFAFVLPILMFFMVGTLEFSTMFLAQNILENAVNSAARTGKTGHVEDGFTREQTLLLMVQQRIDRLMDPSRITLSSEVYKSLDDIGQSEPYTDQNGDGMYNEGEPYTDSNLNGQWDPDMGLEGMGNAGETVVYTIRYPWQVMTPFLREILASDGVVNLSSRLVVKNEPYGNGV